jgi:hypothetical protein
MYLSCQKCPSLLYNNEYSLLSLAHTPTHNTQPATHIHLHTHTHTRSEQFDTYLQQSHWRRDERGRQELGRRERRAKEGREGQELRRAERGES